MSNQPSDERPPEVVESIHWDSLARPEPPDRRWWYVLAAVAVAVAAISASVTRTLWPVAPVIAPTTTLAAVDPSAATPPTPAPVAPESGATETSLPPISEADLMAADPIDVERWVAAHAEWFLTELFTLDGTERAVLAALLPVGVTPVPPPPEVRSYVESVTITAVTSIGDARYRVSAIVRRLSAADGGAYLRQDPAALSVDIGIVGGSPAVLDLPVPESLEMARSVAMPGTATEPPPVVTRAAVEAFASLGTVDPASLVAAVHGGAWRVEADVLDEVGLRWPMAVWLDDDGRRAAPPAPG